MKKIVLATMFALAAMSCTKTYITPTAHGEDGAEITSGQPASRHAGSVVTNDNTFIQSVMPLSGYANTTVAVGQQIKIVGTYAITPGTNTKPVSGVEVAVYDRKGNKPFSAFASSVSIWFNGRQVGSLPATSFDKVKNGYKAFIPLESVSFSQSQQNNLSIAVSALPVIDAATLGAEHNMFAFEVPVIRYHSDNATLKWNIPAEFEFDSGDIVNGAMQSSFTFVSAIPQNHVVITISGDVNNATDHTVEASYFAATQQVTLGMLDMNAVGANSSLGDMSVTISNSSAISANLIFSKLYLYNAVGMLIDSKVVPTNSNVVKFDNIPSTAGQLPKGTTQVFTIKADVQKFSGMFTPGIAVSVAINATDIGAYDENNNRLPAQSITGSCTSPKIYFYAVGISIDRIASTTNTYSNPGGSQSHGIFTMTIPFSVTAYGTTAYIPSVAKPATSGPVNGQVDPTAGSYIQYAIDNGSELLSAGASAKIVYTGIDNLSVDNNGNYQIPVGQTKNFSLVITFTAPASGSYRARLVNVNYNTTDSATEYGTFIAGLNVNDFRTPYVAGQ